MDQVLIVIYVIGWPCLLFCPLPGFVERRKRLAVAYPIILSAVYNLVFWPFFVLVK